MVSIKNQSFAIEVKRYVNSKNVKNIIRMLEQFGSPKSVKQILITNSKLQEEARSLIRSKNVILIDREPLMDILEKTDILDYIMK